MHLQLGPHRFDVTHRAVVVAMLEGTDTPSLVAAAAEAEAQGADVLGLPSTAARPGTPHALDELVGGVAALGERFALPIGVVTSHAAEVAAAFAAGAVLGHDPSGLADPAYAEAVATAGGAVVAVGASAQPGECDELIGLAARLADAGVVPESTVLDAGFDRAEGHLAAALLGASHQVAQQGLLVQVTVGLTGDQATAAMSAAVSLGCRLIRTREVAAARRVRDVLAAVHGARS